MIRDKLFEMQDERYRDFQMKLIPTLRPGSIVGVRTPDLRSLAKRIGKEPEAQAFLSSLPHEYFDENQLHAFLLSEEKDYEKCIRQVEEFLPYVDNWATCDQLLPKAFKRNKSDLLAHIGKWLKSEEIYTVRFAVGMLMRHFLDGDFKPEYPEMVASVKTDEYYVSMMVAWYFATALAKRYDTAVRYLEERKLDAQTHNRTIRKALESFRITKEQKEYMKTLKRKE